MDSQKSDEPEDISEQFVEYLDTILRLELQCEDLLRAYIAEEEPNFFLRLKIKNKFECPDCDAKWTTIHGQVIARYKYREEESAVWIKALCFR